MLACGMLISAFQLPFNDFTQAQVLKLNERKEIKNSNENLDLLRSLNFAQCVPTNSVNTKKITDILHLQDGYSLTEILPERFNGNSTKINSKESPLDLVYFNSTLPAFEISKKEYDTFMYLLKGVVHFNDTLNQDQILSSGDVLLSKYSNGAIIANNSSHIEGFMIVLKNSEYKNIINDFQNQSKIYSPKEIENENIKVKVLLRLKNRKIGTRESQLSLDLLDVEVKENGEFGFKILAGSHFIIYVLEGEIGVSQPNTEYKKIQRYQEVIAEVSEKDESVCIQGYLEKNKFILFTWSEVKVKPLDINYTFQNNSSEIGSKLYQKKRSLTKIKDYFDKIPIDTSKDINYFSQHNINYDLLVSNSESGRNAVGSFSATQSTVSGTGTALSVTISTSLTVTVTAKDSSGNNIGTGGELIWIRLQQQCARSSNNFYCDDNLSSTFALSSAVWTRMTDNSDGTYSYTYTPTIVGKLTLFVYYFQSAGFYSEFFTNGICSSSYTAANISSTINYSWASSGAMTTGCFMSCSSCYYGLIKAPVTGTYSITIDETGDVAVYVDWNDIINEMGTATYTESYSMTAGEYYYFYVRYKYNSAPSPYWTYPGQAQQIIPSSNIYYPKYVGNTPITITVSCQTGYSYSSGACNPICGDGLRIGTEKCDNGSNSGTGGCASDCTSVTAGWVCSGGSSSSADTCTQCSAGYYQNDATNPTTCVTHCSDSKRVGSEKCDDGNTTPNDGCSSDCTSIDSGWVCSGGSSSSADTCTQCGAGYYQNDAINPTTCVTLCGDNKRVGTEKCDDGNTNNSDGCKSDCTSIESSWVCSGGSSSSKDTCTFCSSGYYQNNALNPTTCVTQCGDGFRVGTEKCDNGSISGTGGCASDCTSITAGWVCSGGSSTSADTCTQCGAGYYQNDATNPTICVTHCGDSKRVGSEKCDDGNTTPNDGCSSDCTSIDSDWICSGGSSSSADTCTKCPAGYHQNDATNPTTCVTVCGDGLRAGTEKCDDGNTSNSDGCKSDCSSIESSWVCSGGSITSKDTCTFCSSGYYQNNAANPTACVTKCGDGFRVGSETCDDGNTVSGDGCTADCLTIETSYVCSGGSSTSKDVCKMCSSINKTNSSKSKCIASSINTNSKVLVSLLFMLIAIGIAFGVMNSIWFGLIPHSFFSAINQLQLFIIVPLLGGITADEILDFDRGISVCLFSFYFVPVKNLFGSAITYDQDIPYLERIYIESNSSPANLASVFAVIFLLIVIHLIVWLIKMCARENCKNSKLTKVIEGTLSFFKFGVYVIFLMECFVYFMLLCVSELERHRLTEDTEIVSFTFAVLLAIFCLAMVSIACYEWMKSYNPTLYQNQTYFSCLFYGVKDDWKYRCLGFLFLMRRLLLCIVVLSIRFASFTTKVGVFTGIQICYFLFLCITRPYKARQDNITEIVTEFFNIVFPAFYFYFNSDSTWTSGIAYFYISLLLIDNIIVAGIQFGIFMFHLYAKEKDRMRIRAETMDISYINKRFTTKHPIGEPSEEIKQENVGYSSEYDPNLYLNSEIKKNKAKGLDDKSQTSRITKPDFAASGFEPVDVKDDMEVKNWNLKKLSFTPKTNRITEQRCNLHDHDPHYRQSYKFKHIH